MHYKETLEHTLYHPNQGDLLSTSSISFFQRMDVNSIEKQIKDIEDEIFNTQKNKNTEHHIGKLKAKIARLRETVEKQKSAGVKGKGFSVKKTGDATIGLIGLPSVGKSTLLNQLTDAESQVASYEFTTLDVIPGMMKHQGANIQILDLPGIITGAAKGKGRGREILSAIRNVDLIILMLDSIHIHHLPMMTQELQEAGIRINQEKPDVIITHTKQGGINITTTTKPTKMSEKTMRSISSEYLTNADIIIREDITEDQLIDVFVQNRTYLPAIVLLNKIDLLDEDHIQTYMKEIKNQGWVVHPISAKKDIGIDSLKDLIFQHLNLIRVYMKPQGKKPDYDEPLILNKGGTVEDACQVIHRDFASKFRYAHVWGQSAKYAGQKVGLNHQLQDEDVLTIIITH
jgi:small GTP-binding protein